MKDFVFSRVPNNKKVQNFTKFATAPQIQILLTFEVRIDVLLSNTLAFDQKYVIPFRGVMKFWFAVTLAV